MIGSSQVHQRRNDITPPSDRAGCKPAERAGEDSIECRQRQPPSGRGIAGCDERDQQDVKEQVLVAERLSHHAEPRPGQSTDEPFLRVKAGDGEMEIRVAVGKKRERKSEECKDEKRRDGGQRRCAH